MRLAKRVTLKPRAPLARTTLGILRAYGLPLECVKRVERLLGERHRFVNGGALCIHLL